MKDLDYDWVEDHNLFEGNEVDSGWLVEELDV